MFSHQSHQGQSSPSSLRASHKDDGQSRKISPAHGSQLSSKSQSSFSKKLKRPPSAPRRAASAWFLFTASRRSKIKNDYPDVNFADISKKLSEEWKALSAADRQRWYEEAQKEKERYQREWEDYQRTDIYKQYQQKKEESRRREEADHGKGDREDLGQCQELSIFTDEFLKHSQSRELEMRQLRKNATDLEEQNAVLMSNIEKMNSAIDRISQEILHSQQQQMAMKHYLDMVRSSLVQYLSSYPPVNVAGFPPGSAPSMANIDEFMVRLSQQLMDSPHGNDQLILLLRNFALRLDFPGLGI